MSKQGNTSDIPVAIDYGMNRNRQKSKPLQYPVSEGLTIRKIISRTFIWLLLFSFKQTLAQVPMPDTVCIGASRTYKVNDATVPSTYTWMIDGITQAGNQHQLTVTWNNSGIFHLSVQEHAANGCDGDLQTATVYVMPLPVADAGQDQVVCFGQRIQLHGAGGAFYNWTPATYLTDPLVADPVLILPAPGSYKYLLQVSTYGCVSAIPDTVNVTLLPPVSVFAGYDTVISAGQPLQLNAADLTNSGFTGFQWTPSAGLDNPLSQTPIALLNNPGMSAYRVTATTANGCIATDDIKVTVYFKADFFVPTGFTPNGDGLNDQAQIFAPGISALRYFNIYNRWGELIFTTKDPARGWDGKWRGVLQPAGVFVWEAAGTDYNGKPVSRKGVVTLIR